MIVGIDNGLDGGIVALSPIAGLPPICCHAMPTRRILAKSKAKGTFARREIDTRMMVAILNSMEADRETTVIYFEECPDHADRADTMRSMAMSAGKIIAIIEAMGFHHLHRIKSHDWHRPILGRIPKGQSKAVALAKARELWPDETWLPTKAHRTPHTGLIDAALIAEYGRRIHHPENNLKLTN